MNTSKHFLPLFIALMALTGCSMGNGTPTATSQSETQEIIHDWNASLSISGGFAGISRQISVNSDGSLLASDERQQRKVAHSLTSEQLARFDTLLTALESAPIPQSTKAFPGRCADCITSRLSATVNGKRYTATAKSGEKSAQPYADLIAQLAKLLREALSKQ